MTQEQKQDYEKIYKLVIDLQKKYWPYEGEKDKNQAFGQVVNFAKGFLKITLEPTDLGFLPEVAKAVLKELFKSPEQETPSIPRNLKDFVAQMDEARAREEARREKSMAEVPKKTYKNFLNLNEKIISQIYPGLSPTAIKEVSREITKDIVDKLPAVARPDLLKPEDYRQTIDKNLIAEKLRNAGFEPKENISEKFLANFEAAKKIAAEPEIKKPLKEEGLKLEKTPDKKVTLPPEILNKFNQKPETATLTGAYTFLNPRSWPDFIGKTVNTVPAIAVKNAIENASAEAQATAGWSEIEEIAKRNVFIEDYEATIGALIRMGVPKNHPFIQRIEDKIAKLKEVQKYPLPQKDGTIIWKDYNWVKVLKRSSYSSYWNRLVGKTEGIYDEEFGIYLVQSPEPAWSQKGTYAYSLRQGLNKFNFIPNSSKKTFRFLTGGRYESFGGIIKGTIYQKGIKPLLVRFGKTAVGQTTRKVFTGLSTRLAAKLGLTALTAGWGTFITALPLIKRLAKKALAIVGGLLLWAAHFGTAAVLGTLAGSLGGVIGGGIAGFKIGALIGTSFSIVGTAIGAIVGFVIGAIVGFFSGVGIQLLIDKIKASLSSPLLQKANIASREIATATVTTSGNVVLGTIASVGVATLIITQITSSAFLGPEGQQLTSPFIQVEKSASFSGKLGDEILYKITIEAIDKNLENVKIKDQFNVICEGQVPSLKPQSWEETEMQSGSNWEKSYSIKTDDSFNNCYISNTVDVSALVDDQSERSFAVASVVIGNPPMDCPHGWPTEHGYITQGPNASFSHMGQEAIDIGITIGNKATATHNGTVLATGFDKPKYDAQGNCIQGGGGNFVMVQGVCKGATFYTWYFHLLSISVKNGAINFGDTIGQTGTSGMCKPAPHLHYEFRPFGGIVKMIQDYVPKTVPPGCGSSEAAGPCGISW